MLQEQHTRNLCAGSSELAFLLSSVPSVKRTFSWIEHSRSLKVILICADRNPDVVRIIYVGFNQSVNQSITPLVTRHMSALNNNSTIQFVDWLRFSVHFKNNLKTFFKRAHIAGTLPSQCHAAPQITVFHLNLAPYKFHYLLIYRKSWCYQIWYEQRLAVLITC